MPSTFDKASALAITADTKSVGLSEALTSRLTGTTKIQRITQIAAEKERILAPERFPSSLENFTALNPLASNEQISRYNIGKFQQDADDRAIQAEKIRQFEGNRDRTIGERIVDTSIDVLGKGVGVALPEMAFGLGQLIEQNNPVNVASSLINLARGEGYQSSLSTMAEFVEDQTGVKIAPQFAKARSALTELQSAPLQFDKQEVATRSAERKAIAESELGKNPQLMDAISSQINQGWEAAKDYFDTPSVLVSTVAESLPQMLVPGGITKNLVKGTTGTMSKAAVNKLAEKVGVTYTAASEGISNAVSVQGEVLSASETDLKASSDPYNVLRAKKKTHKEAQRLLANQAFVETFIIAGTLGGIASKVTGAGKLEGKLFKIDSKIGKNITAKVARGALSEGLEEMMQGASGQFASNVAKSRSLDSKQSLLEGVGESGGVGLAVGIASGGALSGAAAIPASLGTGVKAAAKQVIKKSDKVTGMNDKIRQAVATGSTEEITDTKSPTYKAEQAIQTLFQTIPETDADSDIQFSEIQAHLIEMNQEISKMDESPEQTAANERFNQHLSKLRGLIADKQKRNETTTTEFVENLPDKVTPGVSEKIDTSLNTFGSAPRSTPEAAANTLAQAEAILDSGLSTPAQTKQLEDTITTLKSYNAVTQEVFEGDKKGDFRGINFYQESIQSALESNNVETAEKGLDGLKKFLKSHAKKLADFELALPAWDVKDKGGAISQSETAAIERVESRPLLGKSGNFKIGGGAFVKVLPAIRQEVAALTAAINQSENLIKAGPIAVKGSGGLTPDSGTETKTRDASIKDKATAPFASESGESKGARTLPLTKEKDTRVTTNESRQSAANKGSVKAESKASTAMRNETAAQLMEPLRDKDNSTKVDRAVKNLAEKLKVFVGTKGLGPALKQIRKAIKNSQDGNIDLTNKDKNYLIGLQMAKDVQLTEGFALNEAILENSASPPDRIKDDVVVNKGGGKILSTFFKAIKTNVDNKLQTVSNLFTKMKTNTNVIGVLTDKQREAMPMVQRFNKVFADSLLNRVLKLRKGEFAFEDTFQYFIKAGATQDNLKDFLNENLVSTMGMVALNWVATRSGTTIVNNKSAINGILGRDTQNPVSATEQQFLANAGTMQKNVVANMGADIIRALGIKVNDDVPGQILSNLENALGNMALATLLETNMLTQTTIPRDVIKFMSGDKTVPSMPTSDANKGKVAFIRAATQVNAEGIVLPSKQVQEYMDAIQDSDMVLQTLFGLDSYTTEPSFDVPDEAPTKIKNTFLSVPKKLQKLLQKVQERPFKLHQNMIEIEEFLGEHNSLIIQGIDFNYETTAHKEDREGIKAKNADILRNYNHFQAFRKRAQDKPFYFKTVVWKTMRMGLESNTVNPQTDKYHRFMLGMASHDVVLNPKNRKHMEQFFTAVGQGLGVKVDKNTISGSLDLLSEMFIKDGVMQAGVDAIINRTNPDAIVAAVQKGGENTHSLAALVAYAEFIKADGQSFNTNLVREVDGITNGVAIGLMQLMRTQGDVDLKEMLKRTGIFTDSKENFGEWINKPENLDSYQNMAKLWVNSLQKFGNEPSTDFSNKVSDKKQALRGLSGIIGKMMDKNGITSIGRDLVKNPLMITNYGAGIGKVIAAFTENRISNIYTEIAAAKVKNDDGAIRDIIVNINLTLGKGLSKISLEEVLQNPLEWTMDFRIKQHLESIIELSYGMTLKSAIDSEFSEFINERREIVKATTLMFEGFKLRYESGYKRLVAKSNGNLPSRVAVDELNTSLLDSMPMFKGFFSETNEDGILVMKAGNETIDAQDAKFKTDTRLKTKIDTTHIKVNGEVDANVKKTGQILSYASKPVWNDGGVSGPIGAIHNLDAATMINMQANNNAINIHDAGIFSLLDVESGSQDFNNQFKLAMETYSISLSVNEALVRTMEILEELDFETSTTKQPTNYISKLNKSQGTKLGTRKKPLTINQFMKEFQRDALINETKRNDFIKQITGVDQYTAGEGSTHVTDKNLPSNQETAISDAVDTFRSDYNDIDPNHFNAKLEQEVTAKNVEQVYDSLGKTDTVKDTVDHDLHLRSVLTNIVSRVMDPLKLYIEERGEVNQGMASNGDVYMVQATNATGMSAYSARMSQREIFVHELIHNISYTAVNGNDLIARQLRKLYLEVRDSGQINAESFMEGDYKKGDPGYAAELKVAQLRYDYIFGDKIGQHEREVRNPLTGKMERQILQSNHHEFLAIGATNAAFIKALSKVKIKKKTFREENTLIEKFTNLLESMLTYVSETIAGTRGKTVDKQLMLLAGQLAGIDTRAKNKLWNHAEKAGDIFGKSFDTLAFMITKPFNMLTNSKLVKGSKFRVIKGLGAVAETIPHLDQYPKVINYIRTSMRLTEESFISSFVNELKGRDSSNTYLHDLGRLSNKILDQLRKRVALHVSKMVRDNYKTDLSKEDKDALSKVFIKADIDSLFTDNGEGAITYNEADLLKYLEDKIVLNKEIDSIADRLRTTYTNNGKYYASMALSLGHDMATGRPIEKWSLKNANVIAELDTTDLKAEGNIELAEQLIDRLATLSAIKYTDSKHIELAAKVVRREFAEDANANGILFTMALHRESKRKAMEISFNGQKKLFVKGYTKEILNPNKSFTTAPLSHKEELQRQGYVIGQKVKTDKQDPNEGIDLYFYTSSDGAPATFMAGIFSNTNQKAKGSNITDIYNQMGEFDPATAAYMDRPVITARKKAEIAAIANGTNVKLTDEDGILVPILDGSGNVSDYRYMMDEHKKDTMLDKNNQLDVIMGAMESNIVDKKNTQIINSEVIIATKKYYDENKKGTNRGFTEIGPNAPDEKYREIYHLMPKTARDEIKKVWGGDSMFVQSEEAVLIFGQRKISLSQLKRRELIGLSGRALIDAQVNNVMAFLLNHKVGRYTEAVWQESIKLVKDAIVIKSGAVLVGNVTSNTILLKTLGVSWKNIAVNQAKALVHAKEFLRDTDELAVLKDEEILVPTKKGTNLKRIAELEHLININPVKELFDAGIHQSIIEDVEDTDSPHSYQTKLETFLDNNKVTSTIIDNTPNLIKSGLKQVFMTHDTAIYKFMRDATQLSDFAARFALHEHYKAQGMDPKKSIDKIVEAFINYDLPTHRYLQYGNDMGITMFTKFFIRIQKVIFLLAKERPGSLLATMVLQGLTVDLPEITDSTLTLDRLLNKVGNPLDLPEEIVDAPYTLGSTLID